MSSRYYGKGSSRSTRDDSRDRDERYSRDREERHYRDREKERSRSPRRHSPSRDRDRKRSQETHRHRSTDSNQYEKRNQLSDSSTDQVPAPPPPPRITKISMGFTKPQIPIKMNLGNTSKGTITPKPTIASVFSADDEDEPEEMPAEARMRMRNIGRETPTSAGPNSFGKTKQGFCDAKKVFEKNLKEALDTADTKSGTSKLPQTIYRIKGP